MTPLPDQFQLGDLLVDLVQMRVYRAEVCIPVPKLSFDVLLALARVSPRVASIDDLMSTVWSGLVVNPETVAQRIKLLRDALGDDPRAPRYIESLRGRGYRLLPEVKTVSSQGSRVLTPASQIAPQEGGSAPHQEPAGPALPRTSTVRGTKLMLVAIGAVSLAAVTALVGIALWYSRIGVHNVSDSAASDPSPTGVYSQTVAVMPFVNESTDQEQEYFADGLTDELINLLSNVPDLTVPSRRSSFYFKGKNAKPSAVAKELNVTHLLDGTVRRSGGRLRITAQLVRAADGHQLWTQSYDRDTGEIFKIQDEIAAAVVTALKLKLARPTSTDPARGTTNVAAYDQFLLGWSWMQESTKVGYQRAIAASRKALLLDPAYADAQARLAMAEAFLSTQSADRALLTQAAADADEAVAMGPDRWLVYIVRSSIHFLFLWDFDAAKPDIDRALALNPQNAFALSVKGFMLGCLGKLHEALDLSRKAAALDPLNELVIRNLAQTQAAVGDYVSAINTLKRGLEIDPNNQEVLGLYAAVLLQTGTLAQSRATCDLLGQRPDQLACLALVEHALRHEAAANKARHELIAVGADNKAYEIALSYWDDGDPTRAFKWLDDAYDQHSYALIQILYERRWDGLHSDPRWANLMGKMHLPMDAR